MTETNEAIDLIDFINKRKLGGFQITVLVLCALTMVLDGFDAVSVAFVAPSIAKEWGVAKADLGPIFSANLLGFLVGSPLFGLLADRIGRRWPVMICTLVIGVCTLLAAGAENETELLVFRFLAGLGMGGAMTIVAPLLAEYCPSRRRATLIMIMYVGFSSGASLSGILSATLIPSFGWRSIWYVGGMIPLLTAIAQFLWLPESVRFLLVRGAAAQDAVARVVRRIDPRFVIPPGTPFRASEAPESKIPVVQLFQNRRAQGTLLLWFIYFMALLDLYFLQNWLPVLATNAGIPQKTAILVGTIFQIGGMCACLSLGIPIDRFGPYKILTVVGLVGFALVVILGQVASSAVLLMTTTFFAGYCAVGIVNSSTALAAIFYPTAMRSTGVGWVLGVGRIGAVVGPMVAGVMVAQNWHTPTIFLAASLPLICNAAAFCAMGVIYKQSSRKDSQLGLKLIKSLEGRIG